MNIDFTNIDYLKAGNERQKKAYLELNALGIFEKLQAYNPILTGTIPIGIDVPESDLDIICECSDHHQFAKTLKSHFGDKDGFKVRLNNTYKLKATIATFQSGKFEIEIFGQQLPVLEQNAYKHMLIEHKILNSKGEEFKAEVIQLKQKGLKTEPAFAQLLGLSGNPYEALLRMEI